MGLLFSQLWQRLFGEYQYKICLVGLDNAGKTTTLFQLHLGEVVDTSPTIGSNVEEVVHDNVRFQVWDLGGQDQLRMNWSTYYSNTQAIIMVVDSTDKDRIYLVKDELFKMLKHADLLNVALLVLANKQDANNKMSVAQIAQALELHSIKKQNWHIQACCALTGTGLYEGIDWLTQQIVHR